MTGDELTSFIEQTAEAIQNGDASLTGDAGIHIAETVRKNSAANPNAVSETSEAEREATTEIPPKESSAPAQTHTHNWTAQTTTIHHDAVYQTIHHEAQYQTIHHDAVTEERHICNGCNQDITGNESAHLKANVLNGCGGWHSEVITVQDAYDEQVLVQDAYDEQVLVSDAWDETVITGYICPDCGATK